MGKYRTDDCFVLRSGEMPLLLLPLLLSGCVDEFPVPTAVPYGGDGKGLSVEEAKTFFESYVSGKASRSVEPEEHDNGFYIRRLMLPVGELFRAGKRVFPRMPRPFTAWFPSEDGGEPWRRRLDGRFLG